MEPTEWKQQSPERQRSTERRSTGKPAESHQSRQGPRIIQGKRLQCKSSFHPLPTHTSKWSRPRLCRLPYSPRAHTQQRARALGGYAWHWPGGRGDVLRKMSWRCCYICMWRLSHYHCLCLKICFCNMEKCKRSLLIAHNSTLCMSVFYSAIIKHTGALL